MKVLGHRVLIAPDEQPTQTASGLILNEDREWVATSGTVVQVGEGGSKLAYDARQRALRAVNEAVYAAISPWLDVMGSAAHDVLQAICALKGTADPVAEVQIGDRVAFAAESGHAFSFDGEPFLIVNYDEVFILVAEAEEAA